MRHSLLASSFYRAVRNGFKAQSASSPLIGTIRNSRDIRAPFITAESTCAHSLFRDVPEQCGTAVTDLMEAPRFAVRPPCPDEGIPPAESRTRTCPEAGSQAPA